MIRRILPFLLAPLLVLDLGCKPADELPRGSSCADVCLKFQACPSFAPAPGPLEKDGTQRAVPCKEWLCKASGVQVKCLLRDDTKTCDQAEDVQQHGCK